ncbi:MAG: hypothetical protein CME06_07895 [Gemmatimonadetes bacterium]|nr:hypothetical protein [Gemmatimonadota bacterium]
MDMTVALTRMLVLLTPLAVFGVGCAYEAPEPFVQSQWLGGREVDAATLNAGREAYSFYCYPCHGEKGDGRGPSATGLRTPPRDLRAATFKFAGVIDGLPHDEDLARIVKNGLSGTAMLPWPVPEEELNDIIQYIKTFSPEGEGWRDEDFELGEQVLPGADPWQGKSEEAAVEQGRTLYHSMVMCYQCHPAYETPARINEYRAELGMAPVAGFRESLWRPAPKASATFTRPMPGDPPCSEDDECGGDDQICRFGRCEQAMMVLPPDFTFNELRDGTSLPDLYRTIAVGIPGTAMPSWIDGLSEEDIWSLAHYVQYLTGLRGSAERERIAERLQIDTISIAMRDKTGDEARSSP